MLHIAVCDDEKEIVQSLAQSIQEEIEAHGKKAEISTYVNAGQLLLEYQPEVFHAVFLDIDMPDLSGIKVAMEMVKRDIDQVIIFITNRSDMVFDALKIHPFGFIRKLYLTEELPSIIESLIRHLSRSSHVFIFTYHQAIFQIPVNEIYYFESQQHNITLNQKSKFYIFADSLTRIEDELKPYRFIRIHSGYLVNCRHIFSIEGNYAVLDNGIKLPISRHRATAVKKIFHHSMREFL